MYTGHESHDGGGPDGDVFAAPEHAVSEAAHEGRVKTVLGRQTGHNGVGDPLGDDGETDSETGDEVGDPRVEIISRKPVEDGELSA